VTRKRIEWKLKDRSLVLGERTLIVGVLNVAPDATSDGGRYQEPDVAYSRALEIEDMGADILAVAAESMRAGSARVSEGEEIRRLIPVMKKLEGKLRIPVCVSTYKAAVADRSLELGAEIISDPSGLTFDPALAKVVVKHDAGLVLTHMRGAPETWGRLGPVPDVLNLVGSELQASVHRTIRAGVNKSQIVVDPGLGFGKRKEQNTELLARLPELEKLGMPIMVGPSGKLFLAKPSEREAPGAIAAAVAAAVLGGAHLVRLHDVKEFKSAVQLADALVAARPELD
jgi:dihydropteroate synthase